VLVVVGCWACAGDLEDPERFDFLLDGATKMDAAQGQPSAGEIPKAPECLTTLLATRCGESYCHGAGVQSQVDLISPGLEDRLVGQESSTSQCMGRVFVPTDGSASLLLGKLQLPTPCGVRMPIGEPLVEAEVMCISAWVKAVADASGGN
jgi:hypothetical protein